MVFWIHPSQTSFVTKRDPCNFLCTPPSLVWMNQSKCLMWHNDLSYLRRFFIQPSLRCIYVEGTTAIFTKIRWSLFSSIWCKVKFKAANHHVFLQDMWFKSILFCRIIIGQNEHAIWLKKKVKTKKFLNANYLIHFFFCYTLHKWQILYLCYNLRRFWQLS